jgi:hypothetical protein
LVEAQKSLPNWQVSEQPTLSIGSQEGSDIFGAISGALRLNSGVIVLADKLGLELRYFSPTGKLLKKAGGRGGGPGEFRSVVAIHRCSGDSVFVYDSGLFRMSVFSPAGTYVRTANVRKWSANGAPPFDFWCNPAGVLAFIQRSIAPPPGEGPFRPKVELSLVGRNDSVFSVGTFPASERYFRQGNAFPRFLGRQTTIAVGSDFLYIGTGDGFEIGEYSFRGELVNTLREARSPVPVTPAQINRFIKDYIAAAPTKVNTSEWESYFHELEWPKAYPAYGRLLVDPLDNVWIEEYPIPGVDRRDWSVYSRAGLKLAVVSLPKRFQLLEAGVDYVLGVWRDDFDVEYLRLHSLRK